MMKKKISTRTIVMNWIILILFRILALRTEQVLPMVEGHHQYSIPHPTLAPTNNQTSVPLIPFADRFSNFQQTASNNNNNIHLPGTSLLDRRQLSVINMNNDQDYTRPDLEQQQHQEQQETDEIEEDEQEEVGPSSSSLSSSFSSSSAVTNSAEYGDYFGTYLYRPNSRFTRRRHLRSPFYGVAALQHINNDNNNNNFHNNKSDFINLTKSASTKSLINATTTTASTATSATARTLGHVKESASIINQLLPIRVKKPLIGAHQHQIYSDVDAIAGRMTRLPCFVRPLGPSDSVSLVLWYRGEDISGAPIYSVDARYTPFSKAQHFVSKDLQSRQIVNFTLNDESFLESVSASVTNSSSSSFSKPSASSAEHDDSKNYSSSPPSEVSKPTPKPTSASTAHLYLMPVKESDAGLYWCRVDYKWERTTISIVTVNVIGP